MIICSILVHMFVVLSCSDVWIMRCFYTLIILPIFFVTNLVHMRISTTVLLQNYFIQIWSMLVTKGPCPKIFFTKLVHMYISIVVLVQIYFFTDLVTKEPCPEIFLQNWSIYTRSDKQWKFIKEKAIPKY